MTDKTTASHIKTNPFSWHLQLIRFHYKHSQLNYKPQII